ncbi:MAG: hypothetical protein ACOYVF_13340 [Candidatus Zixiibacteriota bacterium]
MKSTNIYYLILVSVFLAFIFWLSDWENWPVKTATYVVIVALILFFLVRWHARHTAYECPACGHRFIVTAWRDFISPHYPNKKRLRCPACQKKSWCPEIPRDRLS